MKTKSELERLTKAGLCWECRQPSPGRARHRECLLMVKHAKKDGRILTAYRIGLNAGKVRRGQYGE